MSNYAQNRAMQEIDELFWGSSEKNTKCDKSALSGTDMHSFFPYEGIGFGEYILKQLIFSSIYSVLAIMLGGIIFSISIFILIGIQFSYIFSGIKNGKDWKAWKVLSSVVTALLINPLMLYVLWIFLWAVTGHNVF